MKLRNIAALFLLASTTALAQVTDPVLMRVNGKAVTRSEFEYAFNKNNTNLAGEGQTVHKLVRQRIDQLTEIGDQIVFACDLAIQTIGNGSCNKDQSTDYSA